MQEPIGILPRHHCLVLSESCLSFGYLGHQPPHVSICPMVFVSALSSLVTQPSKINRDNDPETFDNDHDLDDQKKHYAQYKSQGSLYYSADDLDLLILFSTKMKSFVDEAVRSLSSSTNALTGYSSANDTSNIVRKIEYEMNRGGLTTSFSIGDIQMEGLALAVWTAPDTYKDAAEGISYFLYAFMGLCALIGILGKIHALLTGADNVRIMGVVYYGVKPFVALLEYYVVIKPLLPLVFLCPFFLVF